jgi:hypothetical protein
MFVHAYKHAVKSENPFEEFESVYKKLEKVFGTFTVFNNLLSVAKVYELPLPVGETFEETFKTLLEEVLKTFFERHSEHFPNADWENFVRKLLSKKVDVLGVPPEVEDAITLIAALEVDHLVSEVYATTKIKRLMATTEG